MRRKFNIFFQVKKGEYFLLKVFTFALYFPLKISALKNILILIGSSENTPKVLQYGLDLAKSIGGNIFTLRANNFGNVNIASMKDIGTMMIRESELYVKSVINSVDTKNIPVKIIACKGNVLASIRLAQRQLDIDLIILGGKSGVPNTDFFVGPFFGSIIKKTTIPALIVPENQKFNPYKNALIATKSGIINKKDITAPLEKFIEKFDTILKLLLVKTPTTTPKDTVLDSTLKNITQEVLHTENKTTYQGLQTYLKTTQKQYDLLCVFRRKRGFFKKLWTKNAVLKKDFNVSQPLLVLSGKE